MKTRYDIYINGQKVPVRLNGYVAGLVAAHDEGVTRAAVNALCAFFCCDEGQALARLDAFVAQHEGMTRTWLIEHLLAIRCGG